MSGGIGESMLIGAAVGGGTALVTGNDPLQGALLGGITGGIGGAAFGGAAAGAGGAAGGAAGAGTAAATNAGAAGLTSAGISTAAPATALNSIVTPTIDAASGIASAGLPSAGGLTGLNPVPGVTTPGIVESAVNPVMAAPMQQATQLPDLTRLGGMQGININAIDPQMIAQQNAGLGGMQTTATPSSWVEQTYTAQATQPSIADAVQVQQRNLANSTQYMDGAQVAQEAAKQPGMFERFGNWYGTLTPMEKVGVGIAGGVGMQALGGGLGQQMPAVEPEEENPYGFATFDRDKFDAYVPTPNVYKPAGMAGGGIAAASPNRMFPQGMQNNAQYAVPSQMPTSAEVVNADYDALTDPYTGQMVRMAEGGKTEEPAKNVVPREDINRYLSGRMAQQPAQPTTPAQPATPTDPSQMNVSQFQDYLKGLNRRDRAAAMRQYGFGDMYESPRNYGYNPYQGGFMGGSAFMPPMAMGMGGKGGRSYYEPPRPAEDFIGKRFQVYTPQAPTVNTNVYRPGYAAGGIAGESHLGGYAAGGNPRLLKGPGDGMSDDIPAVIANKQPARLADGEFVIPADVVSHLGNGSTDAGAKHLHKMMDRVRKARTGKKVQGKQIKPEKFIPA